jgi:hypothetical protein
MTHVISSIAHRADRLGYTWEPQLAVPISSALVFYPISTWKKYGIGSPYLSNTSFSRPVFTSFTMITLLPVLCARNTRSDKIFKTSAWISFAFSSLAFLFMIGMWGVAKSRFEKRGFSASYGNLVISLGRLQTRGPCAHVAFLYQALDVPCCVAIVTPRCA